MKPTVAVAVSGGVDSLVAAHLLKQQGVSLVAIHFRTGFEQTADTDPNSSISNENSIARLQSVIDQIGIPLIVLDLSREFKSGVVDYFISAYSSGRTPNPCLVCNPVIKFGPVLQKALQLHATTLATGHYARIRRDGDGSVHLLRGLDRSKEQSYFLAFLSSRQLAHACFPLGSMTKSQVLEVARKARLHPLERLESQDVCFVKENSYADFLTGTAGVDPQPGEILDIDGRKIGRHPGLHHFTVGQRRGINCPASEPYYVLRLDHARNTLVVGFRRHLKVRRCRVAELNWICTPPHAGDLVWTRIRYRSTAVAARFERLDANEGWLLFESPQEAVTPGQGAVFYLKEEVLGGGIIEDSDS